MLNVKTEAGVRVKRERGLSSSVRRDGSFIQTPIYKVTVKAHFQIPNKGTVGTDSSARHQLLLKSLIQMRLIP